MTGFALPTYAAPASAASGGWSVVDRIVRSYKATADASGTATITGPLLDTAQAWSIEHMVCSAASSARSVFRLYDSSADPLQLLDGTDAGNFGVADWPTGLLLLASSQLVGQWTGADPGAACRVRLQATIYAVG